MVKNPPAKAGDSGSIPGPGRSPGGGNGNPSQYYCLENSIDGGVWQATVHGVTKSQTQLSTHTHPKHYFKHVSSGQKLRYIFCHNPMYTLFYTYESESEK